jgi:hypothetical protein
MSNGCHSNDFGQEYEVSAHTHVHIHKKQGLYAELQGKATTDVPTRYAYFAPINLHLRLNIEWWSYDCGVVARTLPTTLHS